MTNYPADFLLQTPAAQQWKSLELRPHHGINLPLFSLRSVQSAGIGEFPDLIPLIDWCSEIGLDIIQLLPLNDNGLDASPYCALSAFALNPLNLGLSSLPNLENVSDAQHMLQELQEMAKSQRIDYPAILKVRDKFLREYFSAVGSKITTSNKFFLFLSQNSWLEPYIQFKSAKITQQWSPWETWPENLERNFAEEAFHAFVQYLCFSQFFQVKKHAESKGIKLKGDIPILINRESADVWNHQDLFRLDYSAGAPPDMYAEEGQKWGFPLYNWPSLEQQNYFWWRNRLKTANNFYHLYRLDHIVGFYRIWAIPHDKSAKEGHFIPPNKEDWVPHGEKIMRMMLSNGDMLPIGEDLGTIPPEVRANMHNLGICGTKVMRWERNWETDKSYIDPKTYPIDSMTTVSTHDSETLALWWKNSPLEAQEFCKFIGWTYTPELTPDKHLQILKDSHSSGSLFHINLLQEYLSSIPGMTWPNLEDERINIPSLNTNQNWTYRFRPYIEEIIANEPLKQLFKTLLT